MSVVCTNSIAAWSGPISWASLCERSPLPHLPLVRRTRILWIYWIGSILALVFGYVALSQIKSRNERGRGMAIAGVVLGWIAVGLGLLIFIVGFIRAARSGSGG